MKTYLCTALVSVGLLLSATVGAQPAEVRADPVPQRTTGFFLQGQVAFNLPVYGGYYYYGSYNVLPTIRLGWQFRTLVLAAELNYSTFSMREGGESDGSHLFSLGLNVQPVLWRSRKNDVQGALVVGAGVGTVAFSGDSDDAIVIGHLNLGFGVHYFPSRHFGAGVEPGLRIQFVRIPGGSDTLVTVALLYVALSVETILGR